MSMRIPSPENLPVPARLKVGADVYLLNACSVNQTNRTGIRYEDLPSIVTTWEVSYVCLSTNCAPMLVTGDEYAVKKMLEAFRD